jgi:hypothetical protein
MPKYIAPNPALLHLNRSNTFVISLCDHSGNWARPFAEDWGYSVLHYDLKHGDDVTKLTRQDILLDCWDWSTKDDPRVGGVLCAPPCTDFSSSGAQYWPQKDADGTTGRALEVLDACVRLARVLPHRFLPSFWALENPVGRLGTLRPALGKPTYVQPFWYADLADDKDADRYTKKTGLWGNFAQAPLLIQADKTIEPIRACAQGSWLQKLGGKSERTKELRSVTPQGFARAFAKAQVLSNRI